MTMHDLNHPHDERLAALAGGDPEAAADGALRAHVEACPRCRELTADLGRLRTALNELPDLVPSRPIQLLPPVPEPAASGAGIWMRRLFAPVLVAGASLAVVGAVGIGLDVTRTSQQPATMEAATEPGAPRAAAASDHALVPASDAGQIELRSGESPEGFTAGEAREEDAFTPEDAATPGAAFDERNDESAPPADGDERAVLASQSDGPSGLWLGALLIGGMLVVGALALRLAMRRSG